MVLNIQITGFLGWTPCIETHYHVKFVVVWLGWVSDQVTHFSVTTMSTQLRGIPSGRATCLSWYGPALYA